MAVEALTVAAKHQENGGGGMTTSGRQEAMKARLLEAVARGRADQQVFVEQITDDERSALGELDHWSAKDHLAHLNFWRRQSIVRLEAAARGDTPPDVDDFQHLNEETFAAERLTSWPDLIAEAERLFAAVDPALAPLSEEDLNDPHRYAWRKGDPLAWTVIGSFLEHPAEHYGQFYRERGDTARALARYQATVQVMREIFGASEAYGNALYNLGCYYARAGETEAAIDAVRQALPLNPALVEWSKQDSDLDSLRDLPAFQAIYSA
jgi:tetratricopeptide (TPR) repeat protein